MEALKVAMTSKAFTLLLGPKSVGKTRIRKEVISRLESEKKVTIIDVFLSYSPTSANMLPEHLKATAILFHACRH